MPPELEDGLGAAGAGAGTELFLTCSIRVLIQLYGNIVCTFSSFTCGCRVDPLPLALLFDHAATEVASSLLIDAVSASACFRFPLPIEIKTSMQYDTATLGQKLLRKWLSAFVGSEIA